MAKNAKKKKTVGVVLPDWLNVRVEPNGNIIKPIARGTVVDVVLQQDGWCNIHAKVLSGWVVSQYLAIKETD